MNLSDRTINCLQTNRAVYQQSENANLNYVFNWAAVLGSDTIATSTITGDGITVVASNTTTTATGKIAGSPGTYVAVNKIVTAGGQTDERLLKLVIVGNEDGVGNDYA